MLAQGSIAPAWLVVPMAAVTAVVIAGHMLAMRAARDRIPPSRMRIRMASGVIMLILVPVLAYGFGVADATDPRGFVLAWLAAMGLLAMVVLLALIDMGNNMRLAREAGRELAREAARLKAELHAELEKMERNADSGEGGGGGR